MFAIFCKNVRLKNMCMVEKFPWYYQISSFCNTVMGHFCINPFSDTKGVKNRMRVNSWKTNNKKQKPYVVLKKNNHARDLQYYVSIILKTIKNYYFTCVIVNKVCKVLHAHKVLFHFIHIVVVYYGPRTLCTPRGFRARRGIRAADMWERHLKFTDFYSSGV